MTAILSLESDQPQDLTDHSSHSIILQGLRKQTEYYSCNRVHRQTDRQTDREKDK